MLKKGIKYILSFILISTLLVSCSFPESTNEKITDKYVRMNFHNYQDVYKTLNDSIILYVDSLLADFLYAYEEEYEIDSLICINSKGDRLVATINNSSGVGEKATVDAVNKILGKKMNNIWYFFEGGGTLIVPRDLFKKDEWHPDFDTCNQSMF